MSPELASLLDTVNCRPAPPIRALPSSLSERAKLGGIIACCQQLVGHLHVHGISRNTYRHASTIYKLAVEDLSPKLAAEFEPLNRLDEIVAANPRWTFANLSAFVTETARNAVAGSDL